MIKNIGGMFLPFLKWIKIYNKKDFIADFIAGTILAIILLPKSIAYASLAGLPPVYGLYAALLSPAVGALWGSSAQLSTGPAAVISFLVFASVAPLAGSNTELFLSFAVLLAFIVGIIQLIMGLFRTGWIMNFVSHSVIVGFVNAAAIIIAFTQLKDLLGIKVENSEVFLNTFLQVVKELPHMHIWPLIIGTISILIIIFGKKIHKFFPGGIVAVIGFSLLAWYLGFDSAGKDAYHVKLVGDLPSGIPFPSIPGNISWDIITELLPIAFVISIIGFVEAWAIAKSIAAKTKQKLDVNQELVGQGLANIVTGLFKGYPVSGSFSGTAINYSAGGKTAISNVIASVFIILSLLFLSEYLQYLPKAVLAAIVIIAVIGLLNPKEMFHLYKVNKIDGIVTITTFTSAFVMKLDYAIFLGIILSLVLFLYKTMTPRVVEVTKDNKTGTFKNIENYDNPICPQIIILRPEMSMYFANTEGMIDKMMKKILTRVENNLKFLILDAKSINYIDATGLEQFEIFIDELKKYGIEIYFINTKPGFKNVLLNSELKYLVKENRLLAGKTETIGKIYQLLNKDICKSCKTRIFNECGK